MLNGAGSDLVDIVKNSSEHIKNAKGDMKKAESVAESNKNFLMEMIIGKYKGISKEDFSKMDEKLVKKIKSKIKLFDMVSPFILFGANVMYMLMSAVIGGLNWVLGKIGLKIPLNHRHFITKSIMFIGAPFAALMVIGLVFGMFYGVYQTSGLFMVLQMIGMLVLLIVGIKLLPVLYNKLKNYSTSTEDIQDMTENLKSHEIEKQEQLMIEQQKKLQIEYKPITDKALPILEEAKKNFLSIKQNFGEEEFKFNSHGKTFTINEKLFEEIKNLPYIDEEGLEITININNYLSDKLIGKN